MRPSRQEKLFISNKNIRCPPGLSVIVYCVRCAYEHSEGENINLIPFRSHLRSFQCSGRASASIPNVAVCGCPLTINRTNCDTWWEPRVGPRVGPDLDFIEDFIDALETVSVSSPLKNAFLPAL